MSSSRSLKFVQLTNSLCQQVGLRLANIWTLETLTDEIGIPSLVQLLIRYTVDLPECRSAD